MERHSLHRAVTVGVLLFFAAIACAPMGSQASSFLSSASAQEATAPPKSKRPLATKSGNTWICIVVAGVTAVIVYFIGRAEHRKPSANEPAAEAEPKSTEEEGEEGGSDSDKG